MKNLTYVRLIEDLVNDIISSYEKLTGKPISLPIPVFDIGERLFHLKIDIEKLRGKLARTAGFIIPEKRWMILNIELDPARLNFTIAHELGHWLIDSKTLGLDENEYLLSYPLASNDPFAQEVMANYFASVLLMPKSLLVNGACRYKGYGYLQLMAMSSMFNVSTHTMSIRLSEIREELNDIKTPIKLDKPLEYGERDQIKRNCWKYTIINAGYSIVDHNLNRKLKTLKNQSEYLYVIWPREKLEYIETLLEFPSIDGFICTNDNDLNNVQHYLGTEPSIRFIDLQNGLWLENLEKSGKDITNDALVFFPRDNEQLTFLKKELVNINQFIEIPVKLNYRGEAKRFIEAAKAKGQRVVITTGCFDLITNAHVRFLKRAKASGDLLVVGIEDDNRVRAFKGKFRPVNTIAQRVELMEAFQFVDFTFVISGSPKLDVKRFYSNLHYELQADLLAVSENDSNMQDRKEEVEAGGGTLAVVSQIEESSTTSLIRQFLAETEFSDIVYISRFKLKDYILSNDNQWRQLALPLDLKPKV